MFCAENDETSQRKQKKEIGIRVGLPAGRTAADCSVGRLLS